MTDTGNVQRERAKMTEDITEKIKLLDEAIERYKHSLEIQTNHFKGSVYWAQALIDKTQYLIQDSTRYSILCSLLYE